MNTSDYVVTLSPRKGSEPRYHRAKCSKVKPEQRVSNNDTILSIAKPCSSCQPPEPQVNPTLVVKDAADVWTKANDERAALKAWKDGGKKGSPPATPNLDKINGENTAPAPRKRSARSTSTTPKATGPAVRLAHNGKPMPDSQNKLSSVAYYHTKDVEPGKPRVSTDALRAILAKAGIADPEHSAWSHELANGVVLSATLEGASNAAVAS